jgi:hypothetical protein
MVTQIFKPFFQHLPKFFILESGIPNMKFGWIILGELLQLIAPEELVHV